MGPLHSAKLLQIMKSGWLDKVARTEGMDKRKGIDKRMGDVLAGGFGA